MDCNELQWQTLPQSQVAFFIRILQTVQGYPDGVQWNSQKKNTVVSLDLVVIIEFDSLYKSTKTCNENKPLGKKLKQLTTTQYTVLSCLCNFKK